MNNRQYFLNHLAQTSPSPMLFEVSHANGMYLYNSEGKQMLDLIAGIGVSVLGHTHSTVVEAVCKQAETYMHTMVYGEFVLSPQIRLSKLLCSLLPASLDCMYIVNSGTEAVEGALKLAKKSSGRYGIISCKNAYHGSTSGAISLMSEKKYVKPFLPVAPGVEHIGFNQKEDLIKISPKTAAVILEPIQAEAGIILPEKGYLQALRDRCTETGTLLIFDEIQTAFGRTGHMFAFEKYEVVPDILLLAKGLGGGMPIGAFITSQNIMNTLKDNPALGHITTFGGHPLSCAAAAATVNHLIHTDLIQKVEAKKSLFLQLLPHPRIKEIRCGGLWFALELESSKQLRNVVKKAWDQGLMIDWFLFNDKSLRVAPPLIIEEEHIKKAVRILHQVLDTL